MRVDEIEHGTSARSMGAADIPGPIQKAMQLMAKVMTTTAYHL
jgi:ubiquinone biosynthesis monooxygenase Coq7